MNCYYRVMSCTGGLTARVFPGMEMAPAFYTYSRLNRGLEYCRLGDVTESR